MGRSPTVQCQVRQRPLSIPSSQWGFTLIELVTVIVLVGVLSVFVAPRMFDMAAFNARGFRDETLSYLRFAQKSAIAQRRTVCVAFTLNSLSLRISSAPVQTTCDMPVRGPTGDSAGTLLAKGGAAYTTTPANFAFNGLGKPVDASGAAMGLQAWLVNGLSGAITVEPVTGYVHE